MAKEFSITQALANRYNAAAWTEAEEGNTMLVLREVKEAAKQNEPDKGDMILLEKDASGSIVHEAQAWKAEGAHELLEDPRALVTADGGVRIGLTAVQQEEDFPPYPAITILDKTRWRGSLPLVRVIKDFGQGKNTTPIDATRFFFRQEGDHNNHKLFVFSWEDDQAKACGQIVFPQDIEWASWRIGTTMSPIWINNTEALMIIHGIQIKDDKYVYSLGRAKLTAQSDTFTVQLDPEPLLTPDDFLYPDGTPMVQELHPHLRRVVYACGGVVKKIDHEEVLNLYVNVGDRQTIEVPLLLSTLKAGWWDEPSI